MWILLALISALLAASRRTSEKRLTAHLHHYSIAFITQLFALPVIGILLLMHGTFLNPLSLGVQFWVPLLLVSVGFYPLNAFLYLQAVKGSELSKVLPIQSLWPVFTLLPAWLALGQIPSAISFLGIVITVIGVYSLGLKGKALHHPLRPFKEDTSSRYMLCSVLLVTAAGVLDKIAISASEPIYYSFVSTVGAVIVLGAALKWKKVNQLAALKKSARSLALIGTLQGASYTTYLLAVSMGPLAYVSSIRSTNVLIGSVLGIVLLKERLTRPKLASFVLITAGGIVLAIGA